MYLLLNIMSFLNIKVFFAFLSKRITKQNNHDLIYLCMLRGCVDMITLESYLF